MAVAVVMGLVFGQLALAAHDLAHRQVFSRRRASEVGGRIVGNLGIGMSYGWWMRKHTLHHANPNHEELDPDVKPDILVWSQEQARAAKGLPRFIGRHQAGLFFPLLTLEGFNLHVSSVRALRERHMKQRVLEGVLLFAHLGGYLAALFLLLPPGMAVAFLFLHQARLRRLPRIDLRPEPQGHADAHRRRPAGLPAPSGAHLAQRTGRPDHRHRAGRAQLPDRAPPLPEHALAASAPCPGDRARLLRRTGHRLPRDGTDRLVA